MPKRHKSSILEDANSEKSTATVDYSNTPINIEILALRAALALSRLREQRAQQEHNRETNLLKSQIRFLHNELLALRGKSAMPALSAYSTPADLPSYSSSSDSSTSMDEEMTEMINATRKRKLSVLYR